MHTKIFFYTCLNFVSIGKIKKKIDATERICQSKARDSCLILNKYTIKYWYLESFFLSFDEKFFNIPHSSDHSIQSIPQGSDGFMAFQCQIVHSRFHVKSYIRKSRFISNSGELGNKISQSLKQKQWVSLDFQLLKSPENHILMLLSWLNDWEFQKNLILSFMISFFVILLDKPISRLDAHISLKCLRCARYWNVIWESCLSHSWQIISSMIGVLRQSKIK